MLSNKLKVLSLAICVGASSTAFSKNGLTVNGGEGAVNPLTDMSVVGATQRTTTNNYAVRFRASCFGTNLRGVANPISPSSIVTMNGQITIDSQAPQGFSITFPAAAAINGNSGGTPLSGFNLPSGSRAGFSGNLIVANIPSTVTSTIDPVTAKITVAQQRFKISGINFSQTVPADGGQYYANNGALSTGGISINQSSDGKTFDIEASFPGQNGYCGGFYSPLMVFLDEKIPKFENIVSFDMGHGLKTFWPEKNHAGYFLALPKKGKVISNKDLFGETEKHSNGFESLAVHDINKDGVIDKNDPVFKKLVLWKDQSGKGVYAKKDSIPLSQMLKSINLKFQPNITQVSANAEFREKSTVVLANPSKSNQNAYIVDVWFKPALGTEHKLDLPQLSAK